MVLMATTLTEAVEPNLGESSLSFGDAQAGRLGGRLAARAHPELAQDRRHVMVDGLLRQEQLRGDLRVAFAADQPVEHLQLPGGEAIAVLNTDTPPPEDALKEVRQHPQISSLSMVKLPPAGQMPS